MAALSAPMETRDVLVIGAGPAGSASAAILRQTVTAVQGDDDSTEHLLDVRDERGSSRQIRCRFLVDASGYGRVLAGLKGLIRLNAWYDGSLPRMFFAPAPSPAVRRQVCSVLAGYVWDQSNPFVTQAGRKLKQVGRLLAKTRL